MMKITKKAYLQTFGLIVIFLAFVRCLFPSIAEPLEGSNMKTPDVRNEQDSLYKTHDSGTVVKEEYAGKSRFSIRTARLLKIRYTAFHISATRFQTRMTYS